MNRFISIALLSSLVVVGCASDKDKKEKEAMQAPPPELTAPSQPTPIPATPVYTGSAEPAVTGAPAPQAAVRAVPAARPAAAAARPADVVSKTYIVKKGDSLSEIAVAHNTTVKKIMALNPAIKTADKIEIGQKIKLP